MLVRARLRPAAVIIVVLVTSFSFSSARAESTVKADPDLSSPIETSGSGAAVSTVQTDGLKAATPASGGPRILLIGTGVQKSLFPSELQSSIVTTTASDASDTHGYGTLAASTLLQLLPKATVISKAVRPADATWFLADLNSLAATLEWAKANRSSFDLALLAFPPQAALDPVSYSIGYGDYGKFGRGMAMVVEALLNTPVPTKGPIAGIPSDKALRDKIFARANLKQRDAIEKFATQAVSWRRVLAAVDALDAAGIPVVAPSGDFTRKNGSTIMPLVTQTVYGLSALPSVITVGAAYIDGGVKRLSPTSGRGPTLALGAKPDLLAPADVMAMLPGTATLRWPDDSQRAPLEMLQWAKPGVAPTPCPSVTNVYRCVLQGSSMVSAAVASANLASLVVAGTPHTANARAAGDDEILRGIAWAQASKTNARAYGSERDAFAWEQGAGVLTGLRGFDFASVPVALGRAEIGEVQWDKAKTLSVPLWIGGGSVTSVSAPLGSFIGPDATGQAVATAYGDATRVTADPDGSRVLLRASGDHMQGGMYGGGLSLAGPEGSSTVPLSLVQTVPVNVHVDYAYNEFQAGGREGERVEDAAAVLFAGLPVNVGLVGEAFKNFGSTAWSRFGGDPTNSVVIRAAVTKSQFADPSLPDSEHGRAQIRDVPPGFYRFHIMSDHAIEGQQSRGRIESLGIQLASFGPDALNSAGANLLVPSCTGAATGPLGCANRTGEVDSSTGLCVARNTSTAVAFNVYCGEIAYAVPSALVSRAVHLIEHDAVTAKSEWKACGVDMPTDGKTVDFAAIAAKAAACGGPTTPTSWSFPTKAPDCLGPVERSAYPTGAPTDVTATYQGPGSVMLPGRNFPAGVLTYDFKLPALNTYTVAGLSLSYVAENAIVGVRFRAGTDSLGDSSNGIVAIDGDAVNVQPALKSQAARGTSYSEWSVMSANATSGQVSLIVIPTAWARTDLDPVKPIARVQICDVALRVDTFAKQSWSAADAARTQHFPVLDRGLSSQIDPAKSRVRSTFKDGAFKEGSFADAGTESESLQFAVQIPKNTTANPASPHHVRSPRGGPAHLTAARRWTGARNENVLPSSYKANDGGYGKTSLACAENAADPAQASVCKAWNAARAADEVVADFGPDLSVNGRFAGALPLDVATIKRAGGNIAYEISDIDDGGAFDSAGRWAKGSGAYIKRFPVSDFYDDLATPFSLSLINGVVSIGKDASGLPTLTVKTADADGSSHLITAALR